MGTFELCNEENVLGTNQALDRRRLKEECIIAMKVYDSCRAQDCLTPAEIGPARCAECCCIGDEQCREGDIVDPPSNAAAVTVDKLRVKKIIIVEKEPNAFKNGYWDVDLKYVFEYRLTFREADGNKIGSVKANSIYNKKVTLFGSHGSDLVVSTDLLCQAGDSTTLDSDPFIIVEAKASPCKIQQWFRMISQLVTRFMNLKKWRLKDGGRMGQACNDKKLCVSRVSLLRVERNEIQLNRELVCGFCNVWILT